LVTSACTLEAVWPELQVPEGLSLNDSGLVLLLRHQQAIWLAGDAGHRAENLLKRQPVDGLLAGHHGSRTASSEDFLRHLRPGWTVISCGRNNRFGHPHPEVMKRFEKLAIPTHCTAQSGSITLKDKGFQLSKGRR
jgi:competence protein ComEC